MFLLKNKNYRLKKNDYQEGNGSYGNPGRGWYHIYTFLLGQIKEEELLFLPFEEEETIALILINISEYRAKEIDENGIYWIEKIFQCFIRAEKEMILRIVYDHQGKGMEREPALFSMVLKHMEQIGPIVEKYAAHMMLSQGLFVGNWGEMHGSKFLSQRHLKELSRTWRKATNGSVRMAFRRPVQCRQAFAEGECAAGLFDDAIFASQSHLATFGQKSRHDAEWNEEWCMEDEIDFMKTAAPNIPCGGEVVSGDESLTAEDTINMLRNMHLSYLNSVYDERILNDWKKQPYEGEKSLYHYIGSHMGYRFLVHDVALIKRKGTILKVFLENMGFANLCDKAEIKLGIQNGSKERLVSVSYDIRHLMPGERQEISVELGDMIEIGSRLTLEIKRVKDGKSIRFANVLAGERMLLGEIEEKLFF